MSSRLHRFLAVVVAAAVACGGGAARLPDVAGPELSAADRALLDDVQKRTFDWFWETTNPRNGLVPDRWPTPAFSSIAAVGFGLTVYPVGVERGYVTRAQARERTLTTLRFFRDAPQGEAVQGVTGYKGFYYHFLDMETGKRWENTELSTVDTALLLAGVLFCQMYYDDDADAAEREIREIADTLLNRADWRWVQARRPAITMGWDPKSGFLAAEWLGYNEAMIVILLALGSPTFGVDADAWDKWTENYDRSWGVHHGQEHLAFPPHFGHQYSHVWVDFRGIQDRYMRAKGIDYFENSRRATYTQRAYAIANPGGWKDYGANLWGVTACDGPGDFVLPFDGKEVTFRWYAGRGWGQNDDGTLAPTAAVASIPFAPEIAIPATRAFIDRYGEHLYQKYGFLDAINPSFTYADKPVKGKVIPGVGWVDVDYLGIDQGPIVLMIENHRSELVWKHMRESEYLRRGLQKAGFTGGWLAAAQ